MQGSCDNDDKLAQQESMKLDVARAMREILADVKAGRVPAKVGSFGELHDHVDANEYSGFCEDKIFDGLVEMFGGRDAGTEAMPDGMIRYIDGVQCAVDAWIKDGGIRIALRDGE